MKITKPSATAATPTATGTSTSSWATPEAGDVIYYWYLWQSEAARHEESGRKARPCLVLSADIVGRGTVVRVMPITTKNYAKRESRSIPPRVCAMLGLSGPSWIVPTEVNRFVWTGPDVAPTRSGGPYFGKVPRALFEDVKTIFLLRARPEIKRTV